MSRAPTGRMQNLFKNNRIVFEAALKKKVTPYEWGKEVTPGLLAVETVGHTPGHTSDASHSPRNDGNIFANRAGPYSRAHDQRRDHHYRPPPPHFSGIGGRLRLRSSPLPPDPIPRLLPLQRNAV